jgi:hypothetical protein
LGSLGFRLGFESKGCRILEKNYALLVWHDLRLHELIIALIPNATVNMPNHVDYKKHLMASRFHLLADRPEKC